MVVAHGVVCATSALLLVALRSDALPRNPRTMGILELLAVAGAFTLAGLVKGVIGMGLPTVSMGLMVLFITPLEAAALVLLPAFLTNVWQMLVGPHLGEVVRRLWPMLLATSLATWACMGFMTGPSAAKYGGGVLGLALIAYAVTALASLEFSVDRSREPWLGPIVGAATGAMLAATGVFVMPGVPYLAAIGLEKDKLVQALGLCFVVATLALTVNVAAAGALNVGVLAPAALAVALAFGGMWVGQFVRARLKPQTFRFWYLIGMLVLGMVLATRLLR
jgi:uncharacterized membrane protein YfcA